MEWVNTKLPFPVYQQEKDEKCLDFWQRIEWTLPESVMRKEETSFWLLLGARDDVLSKIPFNPKLNLWIDPDQLKTALAKIDKYEKLPGPYRLNRFQNCSNYFLCFSCGSWGHKVQQCRNSRVDSSRVKMIKRKALELAYWNPKTVSDKTVNSSKGGETVTPRATPDFRQENVAEREKADDYGNFSHSIHPNSSGDRCNSRFYEDEMMVDNFVRSDQVNMRGDGNQNSSNLPTSSRPLNSRNNQPNQQHEVVWELPNRSTNTQPVWELPNKNNGKW